MIRNPCWQDQNIMMQNRNMLLNYHWVLRILESKMHRYEKHAWRGHLLSDQV